MVLTTVFVVFFLFFFSAPSSVSALSFNYTRFSGDDGNITCERAHVTADGLIQLTSDSRANIARATYTEPMQLWDSSTGNLTDFSTHFSFIIDSQNRTYGIGDGLAFFLAPAGSKIPVNLTKGGPLGLTSYEEVLNSTDNPFVAVEFDIYKNSWDPPGPHVGIDINSLVSASNISWMSDVSEAKTNEAWIKYDSKSKNLSVVFTGFLNDTARTRVLQYLDYVVDLRKLLPEKVVFGFSASTGNASAAHVLTAWSFCLNLEVAGYGGIGGIPQSSAAVLETGRRRRGNNTGLMVGSSVGGVLLVAGLTVVVWFCLWRRRNGDEEDGDDMILRYMGNEIQMESSVPKKFSYSELANATSHFKEEQKLGEGGFGGVYRGFSKSMNSYVAVKRISGGSKQGLKEYASEIKIISRLRHRNLVQLIGWCHEKRELLLVYEFMPNGSLDSHLFKGKSLIPWEIRYKIARGLASALLYLHEEGEQIVVHRDIKSSNIMLDSDFNSKLGDFGLARLVDHAKGAQTTVLAGTMGYLAPECATTFRATKESDVYSFGIVCLEIACGRPPVDQNLPENQVVLVEWIRELHSKGAILQAADPRLGDDFIEEQMERLMMVGLACASTDSQLRISARQSIQVLDFNSPLPQLPVNIYIPGTTYSSVAHVIRDTDTNRFEHTSSSTDNTSSSHLTESP